MEKNVLEYALDYVSRGLRVIPVYSVRTDGCLCSRGSSCISAGKHPIGKDWTNNWSVDPVKLKEWFDEEEVLLTPKNIGIVTGDGKFVFDVDVKDNGLETWKQLIEKNGEPETFCVRTGSGGLHYYFLIPAGKEVRNKSKTRDKDDKDKRPGIGFDIRGDGGFVVAPPSKHASGNFYVIVKDTAIGACPEWLWLYMIEKGLVSNPEPVEPVEPVEIDISNVVTHKSHKSHNDADLFTNERARVISALATISADCRMDTWILILGALKKSDLVDAEQIALEWSRTMPGFDEKVERQFSASWKSLKERSSGLPTLYAEAKKNGWKWNNTVEEREKWLEENSVGAYARTTRSRYSRTDNSLCNVDPVDSAAPVKIGSGLGMIDILNSDIPPTEWLVTDLIPSIGITTVLSGVKNGKSTFMFAVAGAVAGGNLLHGEESFTTKQGDVRYFAKDQSPAENKDKIIELEKSGAKLSQQAVFYDSTHNLPRLDEAGIKAFESYLDEEANKNVKLLVFDTWNDFIPDKCKGGGKDAQQREISFIEPIVAFVTRRKIAIVFIHHENKQFGSVKEAIDMDWSLACSGSIALPAKSVMMISFSRLPDSKIVVVKRKCRSIRPLPHYFLKWSDNSGSFVYYGNMDSMLDNKATLTKRLHDTVRLNKGTVADICDILEGFGEKVVHDTARTLMNRMVKRGVMTMTKARGGASIYSVDEALKIPEEVIEQREQCDPFEPELNNKEVQDVDVSVLIDESNSNVTGGVE